jgi:hypothetical protein
MRKSNLAYSFFSFLLCITIIKKMLSPQERQIKESIVRLPFLEGRDALALVEHG